MTQRQGDAGAAKHVAQADLDLFAHLENALDTAVVSDALDDLGIREQAMAEHLRPVGSTVKFAGRARTIACVDTYVSVSHVFTRRATRSAGPLGLPFGRGDLRR